MSDTTIRMTIEEFQSIARHLHYSTDASTNTVFIRVNADGTLLDVGQCEEDMDEGTYIRIRGEETERRKMTQEEQELKDAIDGGMSTSYSIAKAIKYYMDSEQENDGVNSKFYEFFDKFPLNSWMYSEHITDDEANMLISLHYWASIKGFDSMPLKEAYKKFIDRNSEATRKKKQESEEKKDA